MDILAIKLGVFLWISICRQNTTAAKKIAIQKGGIRWKRGTLETLKGNLPFPVD